MENPPKISSADNIKDPNQRTIEEEDKLVQLKSNPNKNKDVTLNKLIPGFKRVEPPPIRKKAISKYQEKVNL